MTISRYTRLLGICTVFGGVRNATVCRALILASAAGLFLHATATVDLGYTLRLSYLLLLVACTLGMRHIAAGWRSIPGHLGLAAVLLLGIYVAAGIAGLDPVLGGQARGSDLRWIVYILDLGVGLATIGLVVELMADSRHMRQLIFALSAGVVLAALYGLYQWAAQHIGLPLADINTAPNSDGFSTGHRFQGVGLLGWERLRGTFTEPFFFGSYLALMLPLLFSIAVSRCKGWQRWLGWSAVFVVVLTLALTASTLSWAMLVLSLVLSGALAAVQAGHVLRAGLAGAAVTLSLIAGLALVLDPGALSAVTGRSSSQLRLTVDNRLSAWQQSINAWNAHPLLGYGPGASSVELAYQPDPRALGLKSAPVVLGSSQGIWASSLVDAGILGLLAWCFFFAAILLSAAMALARSSVEWRWAVLTSAMLGLLLSQVGEDRIELRVWFLLAVLLALARMAFVDQSSPDAGGFSSRSPVFIPAV